jgi:hypothetical protein
MSSEQPSNTRPQDETIPPPPPHRLWRPQNHLLDILPTLPPFRGPPPSITTTRMAPPRHQRTIPSEFDVNSNNIQSMAPTVSTRALTSSRPSISSVASTSIQSLNEVLNLS